MTGAGLMKKHNLSQAVKDFDIGSNAPTTQPVNGVYHPKLRTRMPDF